MVEQPLKDNSIKYSAKEVSERDDHAELINGVLVVTEKTSVAHNIAVLGISTALRQFIAGNNGKCKVFTENVALYCNELCDDTENLFLPDIMSVCDETGVKDDGIHTTPVFVAEITSLSTRKLDYVDKISIYAKIGVQEYWVVDLQRKAIVRYLLENDYAPEIISYPHAREISLHTYPSLKISLSRIFE